MNLVGHVAVALEPDAPLPSDDFLVGCMLPDLAAIARVRLARPDGEMGRGVAFHHACDSAFHDSEWFHSENRELRDALLAAGVETGPARACSHAGIEMLLDGALVEQPDVHRAASRTFAAIGAQADALATLAPPESRGVAELRFRRIATSLDPTRYGDARFIAERLHAMTAGRRRIELPAAHVDRVANALHDAQPRVAVAAPGVVAAVTR
jgi:hypothetical protein